MNMNMSDDDDDAICGNFNDNNDNNDSNDNRDSGKRAFGKRSQLHKARSNDHSQKSKKAATEERISFNYNQYWGNVSINCNQHQESNCLLQYLGDDMQQLKSVVK